jgi:hypothetical protein
MIRINVGGVIFHTLSTTLKHAGGLLRNTVLHPEQFIKDPYHDNIVFLDRNPNKFEEILDLCRNNGRPIRHKLPDALFDEIEYYNISTHLPFRFEAGEQIDFTVGDSIYVAWIAEITLKDVCIKTNTGLLIRGSHKELWDGRHWRSTRESHVL